MYRFFASSHIVSKNHSHGATDPGEPVLLGVNDCGATDKKSP